MNTPRSTAHSQAKIAWVVSERRRIGLGAAGWGVGQGAAHGATAAAFSSSSSVKSLTFRGRAIQ